MIGPLWTLVFTIFGLGLFGGFGWSKYNRRKAVHDRLIPLGGVRVVTTPLIWDRARPNGRLTLVLVGTYGVNEGARILEEFELAGCLDDIGASIVVELDERQRSEFLKSIPAAIRGRTLFCAASLLPGGLQNKSLEEVETLAPFYEPQLIQVVDEATQLLRGTDRRVHDPSIPIHQQGFDPATVMLIASPGGHMGLGKKAARRVHQNFPLATIYLTTVIPNDETMRREFCQGIASYQQEGFVRAFFITDNRRESVLNDHAVVTAFRSLWQAPLTGDVQDEPWNCLIRLSPRQMGSVVVIGRWVRLLPVQRTTSKVPQHFLLKDSVVVSVLEGLKAIELPEAKAVELPTRAEGTSCYVIVTLPLEPRALLEVKDEVESALEVASWFDNDGSRHLVWATSSDPRAPQTGTVKLTIVKLETAVDGQLNLEALVRGVTQTALFSISGNGSSLQSATRTVAISTERPEGGDAR